MPCSTNIGTEGHELEVGQVATVVEWPMLQQKLQHAHRFRPTLTSDLFHMWRATQSETKRARNSDELYQLCQKEMRPNSHYTCLSRFSRAYRSRTKFLPLAMVKLWCIIDSTAKKLWLRGDYGALSTWLH